MLKLFGLLFGFFKQWLLCVFLSEMLLYQIILSHTIYITNIRSTGSIILNKTEAPCDNNVMIDDFDIDEII